MSYDIIIMFPQDIRQISPNHFVALRENSADPVPVQVVKTSKKTQSNHFGQKLR